MNEHVVATNNLFVFIHGCVVCMRCFLVGSSLVFKQGQNKNEEEAKLVPSAWSIQAKAWLPIQLLNNKKEKEKETQNQVKSWSGGNLFALGNLNGIPWIVLVVHKILLWWGCWEDLVLFCLWV
jgi:hypothetical protein